MHLYNFTQKHLKLLRQVSILRSSSGSYVFFLAKVTTVIPASGIDQPDLLPSALVVELELIHVYRTVGVHLPYDTWWRVSTPETCTAAYRNAINWISRILLESYWFWFTMYGPMYINFFYWLRIVIQLLIECYKCVYKYKAYGTNRERLQCIHACSPLQISSLLS